MVFLTSTGFTNPQVYELIKKESKKKIERACIITTASILLKGSFPFFIEVKL